MTQGVMGQLPNLSAILTPVYAVPFTGSNGRRDPSKGECPPGEVSIVDDPPPQILDGVRIDPPPQPVCVPEDALEMVLPPGTPPCATPPIRHITATTGEKGPWTCPAACGGGRPAYLSPDIQWVCPDGDGFRPAPPQGGGGGSGYGAQGSGSGGAGGGLNAWYWLIGGAVVLVGGIAAIYYFTGDE